MKKISVVVLLACLAVSCGTVRDHRRIVQPLDTDLTASVGATLFRLNKQGDLKNAFGGRDVYGGKVDKGYAEVKLLKIEESRYVTLIAYDESRDSSETTMDRYRPGTRVDVSQSVTIGGANGIPVRIDTQTEKEYSLSGVVVRIKEVRGSSIVYSLRDSLK